MNEVVDDAVDQERLKREIHRLAVVHDGHRILPGTEVKLLAKAAACSVRTVEWLMLQEGVVPLRYLRNLGTVGLAEQMTLLRSTVAVVGQGGLGGYVTEALARVGVGCLILIDGDTFEESNLNRQLLSTEALLDVPKVEAARQRVMEINSSVDVVACAERLNAGNASRLLAGADVVVDALDRIPTRLMLQDCAQAMGIPMVHGSIAGFLGQIMTICPGDAGLAALYRGLEEVPERGIETEVGVPAATPMAVAAWEAQEVIKILTGLGRLLRNQLLTLDMETGRVVRLSLGASDPADRSSHASQT